MKHWKIWAGLLVLALIVAGVVSEPQVHSETEFLMDTIMTVTVYGPRGQQAAEEVLARLRELDKKLDVRNPESQIYRLNTAPANTPVSVDSDVFYLLQQTQQFAQRSEGAFDITLYPVTSLWGFGTENAALPESHALQEALLQTGSQLLVLDAAANTVTKLAGGVQVDLGAAAKGYAADEAVRILKENGVTSAYLDLGGNIALLGEKPLSLWEAVLAGSRTRPFVVGLQKPGGARGELIDTLSLSDCFVVTSGDYERYFEQNGRVYHHILDPKTGMPADSGLKSVTIIAENGLTADMLSTTLFVLGKEAAPRFSEAFTTAIFIDGRLQPEYIQ